MKIAIIGSGNVGGALARGWSRARHHIVLGVRNTRNPDVVTLARDTNAEVRTPIEAAASGEALVLALPWGAAEAAVKALGSLRDKIVIDCMNPLAMRNGRLGLDRGFDTSGAEALAVDGVFPDLVANDTLCRMEELRRLRPVAAGGLQGILDQIAFERLDGFRQFTAAFFTAFPDLETLPPFTYIVRLQCGAPMPRGTVKWTGVRFSDFAKMVGAQSFANYGRLYGSDGYFVDEDMNTLMHPQVVLAWLLNDEPIPPQHGAPLRLIVPFRYGARSLKAIIQIEFTATSFTPPKPWPT